MAEIDRGNFGEPPTSAGAKFENLLPIFFPRAHRIISMRSVIDVGSAVLERWGFEIVDTTRHGRTFHQFVSHLGNDD